jgi:hypothetical protein
MNVNMNMRVDYKLTVDYRSARVKTFVIESRAVSMVGTINPRS